MTEGEFLRDEGMDRVLGVTSPLWLEEAEAAMDYMLSKHGYVEADMITLHVGAPYDDDGNERPNAKGAWFRGAARRRGLIPTSITTSTTPARHAGAIRVWSYP